MNHTDLPTDALIESYFTIDHEIHNKGGTAAGFSKLSDIMAELEARGVCPRDLESPAWYAAATDERLGVC